MAQYASGTNLNDRRNNVSPDTEVVYHVGWICALYKEMTAASAMFDYEYSRPIRKAHGDDNNYATGRIHDLNVVIACLPDGRYGPTSALKVAQNMLQTFPDIPIRLLVGIGGGIPDIENGQDIRLGDVVVSSPAGRHGGVVQFDSGKIYDDGTESGPLFKQTGMLDKPPFYLLTALSRIRSQNDRDGSKISIYMNEALERYPAMKDKYGYPVNATDDLHASQPMPRSTSDSPVVYEKVERPLRICSDPVVHYGGIASSSCVIKHANVRDSLRKEYGVICVEMEAAGLMDSFKCLVIRGICDYADAFKNDDWHCYAALVAAAYAKEFLLYLSNDGRHQQIVAEFNACRHGILRLVTQGLAKLKIPLDHRQIDDVLSARKDFSQALSILMSSVDPSKPEDLVSVYHGLMKTSLNLSYYQNRAGDTKRLEYVAEAVSCSESALRNAELVGHRAQILRMQFYVAETRARLVALRGSEASMREVEETLDRLEKALEEIRRADPKNLGVYETRSRKDKERLLNEFSSRKRRPFS